MAWYFTKKIECDVMDWSGKSDGMSPVLLQSDETVKLFT